MIKTRFRNFLPIVVDVETGGLNETTDALLEIAVITIGMHLNQTLYPDKIFHYPIKPFINSNLNEESLRINKIDPFDSKRHALDEKQALESLFKEINALVKQYECTRAILVGHNAFFDLKFINAATKRCNIKNNIFHSFSIIDTVTLGALAYKQTVLAKIAEAANIPWDTTKSHTAVYDAKITAEIFCKVFNAWH